jgi:HPt (histidine-containing phosphotransfer) domain-containing protein
MDLEELAGDIGMGENEYWELIELFVETGLSDFDKLNSAVLAGDAYQAASAAHSLKGAAGNLGLVELAEIAKGIEEKALDDRLEGIAESVQLLKDTLDEAAKLARI